MPGLKTPVLCINGVLSYPLLVEVLARVPLRDAFRCMSVCKLWFSSIRNDPYFKKRFIRQRVTEEATSGVEDRRWLIYSQCHASVMLLVTPTCGIFNLSLSFLPFRGDSYDTGVERKVLGSSNGLLLCSPAEIMTGKYYVCNPLTKEWIRLPHSPERQHVDYNVGFICDPFYQVQGDDSSITLNEGFGFKVVCWRYSSRDQDKQADHFKIEVDILSSDVGIWTRSMAQCAKGGTSTALTNSGTGVSYNGRIYWLVGKYEILIYDPNKNEFILDCVAPPPDALCMVPLVHPLMVPFQGLSQCRGSFWAGQAWSSELRVYTLADGEWVLKHNVHILDWLHGDAADLVKNIMKIRPDAIQFWTMHPDNPMIAYLSVECTVLECDFGGRTLKVVAANRDEKKEHVRWMEWSNVLTLALPHWPTPLPAHCATWLAAGGGWMVWPPRMLDEGASSSDASCSDSITR